jgi:hypothetical protein
LVLLFLTPVEPDGRLLLPKPCGARPASVELPCALQLRVLLLGRTELFTEPLLGRPELLTEPFGRAEFTLGAPPRPGCAADGGRLAESCDMRFVLMPLFFGAL